MTLSSECDARQFTVVVVILSRLLVTTVVCKESLVNSDNPKHATRSYNCNNAAHLLAVNIYVPLSEDGGCAHIASV